MTEGFLAPPTGATHIDPVGGLVTSPKVAFKFDERLHHHWRKAIASQPILGQLACHTQEDFRCKPL